MNNEISHGNFMTRISQPARLLTARAVTIPPVMLPWFKPFKILLIQGFKGISNYFQDGILEKTVLLLAVCGYGIYATAYMVRTQQFFSWGLKLIVIY